MTAPNKRSRTYARVKVKLPGGNTVTRYKLRKPNNHKCGSCGSVLHGIPRERPCNFAKLSKTQKRPERPYGGVLCSKCMRGKFKASART